MPLSIYFINNMVYIGDSFLMNADCYLTRLKFLWTSTMGRDVGKS